MTHQTNPSRVHCVLIAGLLAIMSLPLLGQGLGNLNPPAGPIAPVGPNLKDVAKGTPIGALPFTIVKCGSYFLTDCLTGVAGSNGITINADDVTLDLNGFSLLGVPGSLDGIGVNGNKKNLTVQNGNFIDWGSNGIFCPSTFPITCRNIKCTTNGACGFAVSSGSLYVCEANNNGSHGYCFTDPDDSARLDNSRATGNGGDGVNYTLNATPSARVSYPFHTTRVFSCYNSGNGCSITLAKPSVEVSVYCAESSYCNNSLAGWSCTTAAGANAGSCQTNLNRCTLSRNGTEGTRVECIAPSSRQFHLWNQVNYGGGGGGGNGALFVLTAESNKLEGDFSDIVIDSPGGFRIQCTGTNSSCRLRVQGASITGSSGSGLTINCVSSSACDAALYDCSISKNTDDGLKVESGGGPVSLHLQGCSLNNNGQDGVDVSGGNVRIACYSCNFNRNTDNGLRYVSSGNLYCKECTFSDSTTGADAQCNAGEKCEVKYSYCSFSNCTTGSSTTCTGAGASCSATYDYCNYSNNSTSHCTSNCTSGGAYTQYCTECRCTDGGRAYENLCNGGSMSCTYGRCTASRCTYGSYYSCISATQSCYCTQRNCTYTDCSQNGCHYECRASTCHYGCFGVTCSGCNTGYRYVTASGGRMICRNGQCVASNCASHGAYCTSSSGGTYRYSCRECKFTGNGGDGCRAEGAGNYSCTECRASGNQGNGYYCSGAESMHCERCTARDNVGAGQVCEGSNRCVMSVPRYSGNNDGAAVVNTPSATVEGGSIANNKGVSVNATGAGPGKLTVKGCTMTGNAGGNIHVPLAPVRLIYCYRCVVQGAPVAAGIPAPGSDIAPVQNPSTAGPNDNINCP